MHRAHIPRSLADEWYGTQHRCRCSAVGVEVALDSSRRELACGPCRAPGRTRRGQTAADCTSTYTTAGSLHATAGQDASVQRCSIRCRHKLNARLVAICWSAWPSPTPRLRTGEEQLLEGHAMSVLVNARESSRSPGHGHVTCMAEQHAVDAAAKRSAHLMVGLVTVVVGD